jgi:hypothetical protein
MKKSKLIQIIKELILEINNGIDFPETTEYELKLLESFNYNLNNIYPISVKTKYVFEFKDDQNRLNIIKGKENNDYIELKLYWIDETGKPRMDSPKEVSPKTMSTYVSIIINDFLPIFDKFLIRPNDPIRFRLFELLINKYIDKSNWVVIRFQNNFILQRINKNV